MEKIIIEVGSTCTKVDCCNANEIKHLATETIPFKKNYAKLGKLDPIDVEKLIKVVNNMQKQYTDIYVCGTSIFRSLKDEERKFFLQMFQVSTGLTFDIISIERENELTVLGATRNVGDQRVAIFVGGGGSTEISIWENGIQEMVNSHFGVMDVMKEYPDLSEDLASTDLETVKEYVRKHVNLPKQKADIVILAGGGHKFFAENSGIRYESNFLYSDQWQPIMMDIITRQKESQRYYREISLDAIRSKVEDPNWWYATRAMCAFVLVVAEELGAKYIVPTDISMVYGILNEGEENNS